MISLGNLVNRLLKRSEPEPITLPKGEVITLGEWRLDEVCAEALHRPVDSFEYNLRIHMPDKSGSATAPRASWYLAKQDYVGLMDLIRDRKMSFDEAKGLVDGVRSDVDVQAVRDYMAEAATRNPSVRESSTMEGYKVINNGPWVWVYPNR